MGEERRGARGGRKMRNDGIQGGKKAEDGKGSWEQERKEKNRN